jgi:hypothetical protein
MAFSQQILKSHQRYTTPFNLGFLSWGVECEIGFVLDSELISLLDEVNKSEIEQLEALKISIAKSRMTALDVVTTPERSREIWTVLSAEISSNVELLGHFLDPKFKSKLETFATKLEINGSAATDEYSLRFVEFVDSQKGNIGLVASRNRFSEDLRMLCHSNGMKSSVINGGASFIDLPRDFDALHIVGTFNRATGKALRQTRRLISSGIAEEIIFVRPSFAYELGNKSAFERLFPALNPPDGLEILSLGGIMPRNNKVAVDEVIDFVPQEAEALAMAEEHQSGPVDCRLILLPGEIAIPIETVATRVPVLNLIHSNSSIEVEWKDPFDELSEGDFVFATVEKTQSKSLRDFVVAERPDHFAVFFEKQRYWKTMLSEISDKYGWDYLENKLKEKGSIRPHRVRSWTSEDFIRPQSDLDYAAILELANFSSDESNLLFKLAKDFDSSLIRAGQEIGRRIWQSLDQIQIAKLKDGYLVELQITGLGAGLYVVGPVLAISESITSTTRSQVRKVVKVRGQF